jgi:hypothetical protein
VNSSRDNEDVRWDDVINGCVFKMALAAEQRMEQCCGGAFKKILSNQGKRTTGWG